MTNIQKLINDSNKNRKLFANTIIDFKNSQGSYCRLFKTINELDEEDYSILYVHRRFNIPMAHDFLDDFDIRLVFTKPCAKSVPQVVDGEMR